MTHKKAYNALLNKLLLAATSGLCISVAQLDPTFSYFAWVGFVPLLIALRGATYRQCYLLSLICGMCMFISGKYWIFSFIITAKGFSEQLSLVLAVLYWLYCSHLLVFTMLLVKWLTQHARSLSLFSFPVMLTLFQIYYPMVFPWYLADSQLSHLSVLQAIEYTGTPGVTLIVALANTLLVNIFMARWKNRWRDSVSKHFLAVCMLAGWFGYGLYSEQLWTNRIEHWRTLHVGFVQPNEPPDIGPRKIPYGYSSLYLPEMEMTEQLIEYNVDLVVWPESQYKGIFDNKRIADGYQSAVNNMNIPILLQDFDNLLSKDGEEKKINAALLIQPNSQTIDRYEKQRLIPFGETLPFANQWAWLDHHFSWLLGEFLGQIVAGQQHHFLTSTTADIIPLICYETVFPQYVAAAVQHYNKHSKDPKGGLLVALSNDGWFGSTHQPFQHVLPSSLRAIENRMPLVHVANNGPSIAVTPTGKVLLQTEFMHSGSFHVNVPYTAEYESTVYARYPNGFSLCLLAMLAAQIVRRLRASRSKADKFFS
jgi:apolipoprotein N-acyltransferase